MPWYKKNSQKENLLNATQIWEKFTIWSQRLNLILSELWWIEKDISWWNITKLGISLWWKQWEHSISWNKYVTWPNNILSNKDLLDVFNHEKIIIENSNKDNKLDFREKFEAKLRTQDGHFVRSKSEVIIDNFLYQYWLVHAYERKLPIEEDIYCDFYIPSWKDRPQAVYIEYWGIDDNQKYIERKNKKIEIYKREWLNLIELTENDIQNLDDILPKKLLQYKIKIY